MNTKFLSILTLGSSLILGACNQNSSGPGTQKLGNQNAKVIMQSLSSLGQLSNSKRQAKQMRTATNESHYRSDLMMHELFKAMALAQTDGLQKDDAESSLEESAQEKATRMGRLINENNCQIQYPTQEGQLQVVGQPSQTANTTTSNNFVIPTFKIQISGPQCPVNISMEMSGTASDTNVAAQFDWKFKAISPEIIKETDISDLQLHGDIIMNMANANANGFAMTMNFNFSGSGTSKSQGSFSLASQVEANIEMQQPENVNGSNPPAMPSMKISAHNSSTLTAGGKTISFASRVNSDGTGLGSEEYLIDGNQVSQLEYIKTVGDFKIPGLENFNGGESQNRNNGPTPISREPHKTYIIKCQATFYEPSEFSLIDLKKYAQMGFAAPNNYTTTLTSTTTQGQADLFGKAKAVIRYEIKDQSADVAILVRNNNGQVATSPTFSFDASIEASSKGDAYTVGDYNAFIFCQSL